VCVCVGRRDAVRRLAGVPRLTVNGPPGVGKSTLARRYLEDHPLALNLDIDRVRGPLGRWSDQPARAGLLARDLSLAMASVHTGPGTTW
jgi:predicted kinase